MCNLMSSFTHININVLILMVVFLLYEYGFVYSAVLTLLLILGAPDEVQTAPLIPHSPPTSPLSLAFIVWQT